jgi:hypothetical protein
LFHTCKVMGWINTMACHAELLPAASHSR